MWRTFLLAAVLAPVLSAQFSGLFSSSDGSSVYFASTLRLRDAAQPLSAQPLNTKIYTAGPSGVQLFAMRERMAAPSDLPVCTAGGFSDYVSAQTSTNGVVALVYGASANGGCSFPVNAAATEIRTSAGSVSVPGVARLASSGRYAIVFLAATNRPFSPVAVSYYDLQTGAQMAITFPPPAIPPGFTQAVSMPANSARIIANDGTALVALTDGLGGHNSGYVLKPGAPAQPFPIDGAAPLLIDASGSKVIYRGDTVGMLDLATQRSKVLITAGQAAGNLNFSDDGRRLLFLRDGQVHVLDTESLSDRVLTADPAKITEAALSGDGSIVWAVTGSGRLLQIRTGDGDATEVVGRTPYLAPQFGSVVPGLTATLRGSALSDSTYYATVPVHPYLDGVTMWIGERKVPLVQLTPTSVSFIVPWDLSGPIRMLAEAPGEHTPFYFPEVETTAAAVTFPVAGPIARQDWSRTYSGPVNTGEIIHVYAIGFGPVSPEVAEGAAAPMAEPFSRITKSLTCSNADVLYAGLAPGAVERVYQIDLRIGPTAGYQKFLCTLGGELFGFLTLNVVQ
jgi:uncharacterized protein (TIGR03437 family)